MSIFQLPTHHTSAHTSTTNCVDEIHSNADDMFYAEFGNLLVSSSSSLSPTHND